MINNEWVAKLDKAGDCKSPIEGSSPSLLSKQENKMPGRENYDEASPIQKIGGLVTTERSGLGKWGWKSKQGLIELCSWMKGELDLNFKIAEVGCYAGESTMAFGYLAGEVVAIDPWKNGYDPDDLSSEKFPMEDVEYSFDQRIKGYTNIKKYKMTGDEAVKYFKNKFFDIVYIDAVHKIGATREEIKRWIEKIKPCGYIAGHDFCGYWGEVVDAVLETIGLPDQVFTDGSWIKQLS